MQKQTVWIKKGHDPGDGSSDLFVCTDSKMVSYVNSVDIINSKNYPGLQDLEFGEVREVEIRIKGRK